MEYTDELVAHSKTKQTSQVPLPCNSKPTTTIHLRKAQSTTSCVSLVFAGCNCPICMISSSSTIVLFVPTRCACSPDVTRTCSLFNAFCMSSVSEEPVFRPSRCESPLRIHLRATLSDCCALFFNHAQHFEKSGRRGGVQAHTSAR